MSTFLAIALPPGLLEQARAGERSAQEALYRSAAAPVYTLLRRLVLRPAVAIDALQSRIQLLDVELSSADGNGGNGTQTRQLWGERVQLLNSLVGMRYAEAVRVDVQAATHEGAI